MPTVSPDDIRDQEQAGAILVSDKVRRARLRACQRCPMRRRRLGVDYCGACGCLIEFKSRFRQHFNFLKGEIVQTDCPKGRWPDAETGVFNNTTHRKGQE